MTLEDREYWVTREFVRVWMETCQKPYYTFPQSLLPIDFVDWILLRLDVKLKRQVLSLFPYVSPTNVALVNLFLYHGADVESRNKEQRSLMDRVLAQNFTSCFGLNIVIVDSTMTTLIILLRAGAKVPVLDENWSFCSQGKRVVRTYLQTVQTILALMARPILPEALIRELSVFLMPQILTC